MTTAYAPPVQSRPSSTPKLPRWTAIEWFVLSITFMPALVFIPGISFIRTPARCMAFILPILIWLHLRSKPRKPRPKGKFAPLACLNLICIWIGLQILNPLGIAQPLAVVGEATLLISVVLPAFWVPMALKDRRQIHRIMAILFFCNGCRSADGRAPAHSYPGRFDPPVIPALGGLGGMSAKQMTFQADLFTYQSDDGTKVMRPCGLTDTPGGASVAGCFAGILGICWALELKSSWKRLVSLGFSFLGVAAIYYTQVRSLLIMLVICLMCLWWLLVRQGNVAKATKMAVMGGAVVAGAFLYAVATVGKAILERFSTLVKQDPGSLYGGSRGRFVADALQNMIFQYPWAREWEGSARSTRSSVPART